MPICFIEEIWNVKRRKPSSNGLKPDYQAMVVHKKDDPTVGMTDLLSAIHKCEENQENNRHNQRADYTKTYPPSTSCPSYRDNHRDNGPSSATSSPWSKLIPT